MSILRRRVYLLALISSGLSILYLYLMILRISTSRKFLTNVEEPLDFPSEIDLIWMKHRLTEDLTPLAKWLLSREGTQPPALTHNGSRNFLILIWQHGPFLERRHLRRFSRDKKFSAWEGCSVSNCELTYRAEDLDRADAVIFHLHRTQAVKTLPRRKNLEQRWIFLSDESPRQTFLQHNQSISDYNGLFNWSMTYRIGSDVPVPYGRTILRSVPITTANLSNLYTRKKHLVAVLGSNCFTNNGRWEYISELKKILGEELTIIGRCLNGNKTMCPGHFDRDCQALQDFKFYLAFENSNCREYLTEKVWWNAYEKLAVPVIMGAPEADCERLLPPGSYLHVNEFTSPKALVARLLQLDTAKEYARLHAWRSRYRVINEHGYFGSPSVHYCRACEALNYNSPLRKFYPRLLDFTDERRDCF